jgi:cytoskeleton protein RodZ
MTDFGNTLRQARALKGKSLYDAERDTYINRHHLAALEEERFDDLPNGGAYRRGIVRSYASYLSIDPVLAVEMYERAGGVESGPTPIREDRRMPREGGFTVPNYSVIGVTAVLVMVTFAWLYSAYFGSTTSSEIPEQIIATVTPVDSAALVLPTPTPLPPTPTPAPIPTATATAQAEPTAPSIASNGNTASSGQTSAPPPPSTDSNKPSASIKITALGSIYVQIVVDGKMEFEGNLASGASTQWVSGTDFEVYTTDGSLTLFTNDRGLDFYMGYGADETYYLRAGG